MSDLISLTIILKYLNTENHSTCIFYNPFIVKNLDPQMKTGFQNLTTDAYDLEDMKKSGTTSAEFSPIHLLAGEFPLYSHE